jgi:hypothetical protein
MIRRAPASSGETHHGHRSGCEHTREDRSGAREDLDVLRHRLRVELRQREGGPPGPLREGQARAVERHHSARLGHRGGSRRRDHPPGLQPPRGLRALPQARRPGGCTLSPRQHLLDALAVPPWRAGRNARRRAARRCRPLDRREVLRVHADHGRGPPRGGVRSLPAREARVGVAHQPEPQEAARHHPHRQPLGHEVSRHADPGRGSRHGGVRQHVPDGPGAAHQGAAPQRDARRVAASWGRTSHGSSGGA